MRLVSVLVPLPFNKLFDYTISEEILLNDSDLVGCFVLVPFKSKEILGIIWAIKTTKSEENSDKRLIKQVIKVYLACKVTQTFMKFIERVAEYNMMPLGMALKLSMPKSQKFLDLDVKEQEIAPDHSDMDEYHKTIALSSAQKTAADQILFNSKEFCATLLDGVTGSGKTEVYCAVIDRMVVLKKQILVLLPEIVLSTSLFEKLKYRFKTQQVSQWHSSVTAKNKKLTWQAALRGESIIVIGARSALFLPFSNLGLIVVDEEHDSSFKQEEGQIYHARDMAVFRAKLESIPIVLASATPSIETYCNAKNGKYKHTHLPERFSRVEMPEVKIIDMNSEILPKGSWISSALKRQILNTLEAKKQSIIFLNRRGYAPLSICKICGSKAECKNCNFYLVLHKQKNILQCHYCGYNILNTNSCQSCGGHKQILVYGPGIERVEEELKSLFPGARIAVFTSDTATNHKTASAMINAIHNRDIDIIIGTQIIAKGLHFKDLHLVGVIDADAGSFSCDPRSLEKTYQLIHQVSGRAGRESTKGVVCLQAYMPNSVVLQNIALYDREGFLRSELNDRELAMMPPFARLALITFSCANESKLLEFIRSVRIDTEYMLGPTPAPIFKLRSMYRYRVIARVPTHHSKNRVGTPKPINIQNMVQKFIGSLPQQNCIKIKIDIDPYTFI
ncbi:MAG: replication restart helicase PriA [Candidatus Lariskella arthropodorum]